jgi:hypothetical protein
LKIGSPWLNPVDLITFHWLKTTMDVSWFVAPQHPPSISEWNLLCFLYVKLQNWDDNHLKIGYTMGYVFMGVENCQAVELTLFIPPCSQGRSPCIGIESSEVWLIFAALLLN